MFKSNLISKKNCLLYLCAVIIFLLPFCSKEQYIAKDGDLIFVVSGTSDFSDAIVGATADADSVCFDHVAIVKIQNNIAYVIEASSTRGVICRKFSELLSETSTGSGKYGLVVKRINVDFPLDDALQRAISHLGEDYDWSFYPDNQQMYCSELVYDSFRNYDGTAIFSSKPMRFSNNDGTMSPFWIELFGKLGKPIPEGILGTNPNDMSKDSVLTEVYRFF